MGVIAVETKAVEVVIPADPGNPDSEAKVTVSFHFDRWRLDIYSHAFITPGVSNGLFFRGLFLFMLEMLNPFFSDCYPGGSSVVPRLSLQNSTSHP